MNDQSVVPYWRLFIGESNVLGQKFSHFIGRPLRQDAYDKAKLNLQIDAIEPARPEQTVQQRTTLWSD